MGIQCDFTKQYKESAKHGAVGALQCTEGQVLSTEEPLSATGRWGLRGPHTQAAPQMHWCQDPCHNMCCAGLSGTEGDVRDRDGERWRWGVWRDGPGDGDRKMEIEEDRERETEMETEREMESERWRRGRQEMETEEDREREMEMQKDKEDRGRERGVVSLGPQGAPSSSLSISTFQPKGAFLTPALILESQVLHSMSRK